MAHFYFHVRQQETIFEDRRGGEFVGLLAAWDWAVADARAMMAEGTLEGPIELQWIEICDTAGTTVATMPFQRALPAH